MGRELKRKQAKREGRNVKEVQIKKKEANELKPKSLLTILGVLVLVFGVLYLITGLFITKDFSWFDKKKDDTSSDTNNDNIVSNRILAVDTLNQGDDEYYVYYYDSSDKNDNISSSVDSLSNKVYRVDLNDGFNSNYVGEVSGIVDDISELRVISPTIIKVSNGRIIEFYSGSEEVNSILD